MSAQQHLLSQTINLKYRIIDRGLGIRPGEADLDRSQRNAVNQYRFKIGTTKPCVPQAFSSLKRFNLKIPIVAGVKHLDCSCALLSIVLDGPNPLSRLCKPHRLRHRGDIPAGRFGLDARRYPAGDLGIANHGREARQHNHPVSNTYSNGQPPVRAAVAPLQFLDRHRHWRLPSMDLPPFCLARPESSECELPHILAGCLRWRLKPAAPEIRKQRQVLDAVGDAMTVKDDGTSPHLR
jgi:hypothetical protein